MKPTFSLAKIVHAALFGVLLLTGCPGTEETGHGSSVAGIIVEGIQEGTRECHNPENADDLAEAVLGLVNEARASRGLHPLTLDPVLSQIAENYCCEMIAEGFFDHIHPNGKGPAQRAIDGGYVFLAIGENLAGGQASPEQVMLEWMNSTSGHRENILAYQWREIGIGVRTGGDYGVYWVQVFGNPP